MSNDIELAKQKKFDRMIAIHSCHAYINDMLEKVENYDYELEVVELMRYLRAFNEKLEKLDV